MSVTKINGIRAPYRSETFRGLSHAVVQANRLLHIEGGVSQLAGTVTVPALSFIQNGLVVKKDTATTLTSPGLEAPYYLTVSSNSVTSIDDLNFYFVKSPFDVQENSVLIASYDGTSWLTEAAASLQGLSQSLKNLVVDLGEPGPVEGLKTAASSTTYTLSPGRLFDTNGDWASFDDTLTFSKGEDDADLPRVDRVVYRRGKDSPLRSGKRSYLVGATYAATVAKMREAAAFPASSHHLSAKILVQDDNTALVLSAERSGTSSYSVVVAKYSSNRQTKISTQTVALGMTSHLYDAALDSTGALHFVYEKSGNIYHRKLSAASVLSTEVAVDETSAVSRAPCCQVGPDGVLYVVYQSQIAAEGIAVMFATMSLSGSLLVAPKDISANAKTNMTPSFQVTDDLRVHVAWCESTLNEIFYGVYDNAGFNISLTKVSSGVFDNSSLTALDDSLEASLPKILIAANRETQIAFVKKSSLTDTVICFWNGRGPAQVPAGLPTLDSVNSLSLAGDPLSCTGLISIAHGLGATCLKTDGKKTFFTLALANVACQTAASTVDRLGSLLHAWGAIGTSGNELFIAKSAAETEARAFSAISPSSDTLLAKVRRPSNLIQNWVSRKASPTGAGTIAVVGTATIDWAGTQAGALTVSSGLSLVDLYNNETFTILSGSYPLAEGEALYLLMTGGGGSALPISAPVANLPWESPIAVLGVRSGGSFNAVLLGGSGGFSQLSSAEQVVFGQELSSVIKSRLGLQDDTAFDSYTSSLAISPSDSYPAALSNLDLMAAQNPHITPVGLAGDWGLSAAGTLTLSQDAYISVPGLPLTRNKVAAQALALSDGEVAYVSLNRAAGADATLTLSKAQAAALTIGRNTIALFRRVGSDLLLAASGKMIPAGSAFNRAEDTDLKGLRVVDLADFTTTSLPSTPPTIASTTVTNRMKVLYGHSSLNKVYLARVSGGAVTWEALACFNGSSTPAAGDRCFAKATAAFPLGSDYFYNGSWNPLVIPVGNFGALDITTTGTLSAGATTVSGALSAGATTVSQTLTVAGDTTLGGAVDAAGKVSSFSDLASVGASLNKPGGKSWKRATGWEYANNLLGSVYANGQFVAVGTSGIIATSPDGLVWTSRDNPSTATLNSVAYGNGQYVAVGAGGAAVVSSDGVFWKITASGSSQTLNRVIYAGSRFVAVGNAGTILTSSDGWTWTSRTPANRPVVAQTATGVSDAVLIAGQPRYTIKDSTSNIFSNVLAGDRLTIVSYFALGPNDGSMVLGTYTVQSVSGDTVTMTTNMTGVGSVLTQTVTYKIERPATNINFYDVAHDGTRYVVAGSSGTLQVSTDSITWSISTLATTFLKYSYAAIAYGSSKFVVVGYATSSDTSLLNSADGATWSPQTSVTGNPNISNLAWSGSSFVAAGVGGKVFTSTTGAGNSWTLRTIGPTNDLRGVSYGASKWLVMVSDANSGTLTSLDSVSWAYLSATSAVMGGAYGNGKYVVVGSGLIFYSTDGLTWSAALGQSALFTSVAYGGGVFAAVGSSGAIATSTDGVSWATVSYSSTTNFNSVTWDGGKFVAVGSVGSTWVAATSLTGASWVQPPSATGSGILQGVASGPSGLVAVGNAGLVLTSTDAAAWQTRTSGSAANLFGVAYGNGQFVAAGSSGTVLTSSDNGVSWTSRTSGTSYDLQDVAYGKKSFVVVGSTGTVRTSTDAVSWSAGFTSSQKSLSSVFYGNKAFISGGAGATVQTSGETVALGISEAGDLFRGDGAQAVRPVFSRRSVQLLSARQEVPALENNSIYVANSATGITVYLGSVLASSELGVTLRFKNIGSNTLTIQAWGGETIDGNTTLVLGPYGKAEIMAYPTLAKWYILTQ